MSVSHLPSPQRPPSVSEDEFLAWRDDPVTAWILSACRKASAEQREAWNKASWDAGSADPLLLTELRTRSDAYLALADTSYRGWVKTHGEDE